eukprot:1170829-Prorocentrum_lima.AAC.1
MVASKIQGFNRRERLWHAAVNTGLRSAGTWGCSNMFEGVVVCVSDPPKKGFRSKQFRSS